MTTEFSPTIAENYLFKLHPLCPNIRECPAFGTEVLPNNTFNYLIAFIYSMFYNKMKLLQKFSTSH